MLKHVQISPQRGIHNPDSLNPHLSPHLASSSTSQLKSRSTLALEKSPLGLYPANSGENGQQRMEMRHHCMERRQRHSTSPLNSLSNFYQGNSAFSSTSSSSSTASSASSSSSSNVVASSSSEGRTDSVSLDSSMSCSIPEDQTLSLSSSALSLQEGHKTPVRIWMRCLLQEMEYKTLLVSQGTSAREVVNGLLAKFRMRHRDPNLFYLAMELTVRKSGAEVRTCLSLEDDSCPAQLLQCHPRSDSRLALRMRNGGLVRVYDAALMEGSQYKSLLVSERTTSAELLSLVLACNKLMENVNHFALFEVFASDQREEILNCDDSPLQICSRWKAKDEARLVARRRKPEEMKNNSTRTRTHNAKSHAEITENYPKSNGKTNQNLKALDNSSCNSRNSDSSCNFKNNSNNSRYQSYSSGVNSLTVEKTSPSKLHGKTNCNSTKNNRQSSSNNSSSSSLVTVNSNSNAAKINILVECNAITSTSPGRKKHLYGIQQKINFLSSPTKNFIKRKSAVPNYENIYNTSTTEDDELSSSSELYPIKNHDSSSLSSGSSVILSSPSPPVQSSIMRIPEDSLLDTRGAWNRRIDNKDRPKRKLPFVPSLELQESSVDDPEESPVTEVQFKSYNDYENYFYI